MSRSIIRRTLTATLLIAGAAMLQGCVYDPNTGGYYPCCASPAPAYGYGYPGYGYGYPAYGYGGGYGGAVVVGGGWGGGYYHGGGWGGGWGGGSWGHAGGGGH
jgi:hypothetical protein